MCKSDTSLEHYVCFFWLIKIDDTFTNKLKVQISGYFLIESACLLYDLEIHFRFDVCRLGGHIDISPATVRGVLKSIFMYDSHVSKFCQY